MKATSQQPATVSDTREQDKTGNIIVAIFVAVCFSLAWLLLHQASVEESANLALADRDLPLLLKSVAEGAQTPFYYLLLHGVMELFGSSVIPARLLSLGLYLAIPFVAFKIGRRINGDEQTGRITAALIGLSPFVLWYSNKATPYAALALVTVINQYFYSGILLKRQKDWVGYLISGLIGLLTHYFFALILLVQFGFYVAKRRSFSRQQHIVAFGVVVALLSMLVWWVQYANASNFLENIPQIANPSATDVFIIYIQFLFGIQSVTMTTLILSLWPLLVVIALLGVQKYIQPPLLVQYFVWASFLPVLFIFATSWMWRSTFLSSYLIICLPAFLVFLGWFLTATHLRSLRWVRYLLMTSMMTTMVVQFFFADTPIQDSYPRDRRLEERIEQEVVSPASPALSER
jgi:mannosyltransferase